MKPSAVRRIRLTVIGTTVVALGAVIAWFWMPGSSHTGPQAPLNKAEQALKLHLRADVATLATRIGKRSLDHYTGLQQAAYWVEASFLRAGYQPTRQSYEVFGKRCDNIEAEIKGRGTPEEIVLLGAHYDSISSSVAANDNGSGVAVMLAVARALLKAQPRRTVRFVGFTNEENFFQTEQMGSWVYAKRCKARGEKIVGAVVLDTVGYYTDAAESQRYPVAALAAFYPSQGNFVAVVGNPASRSLVREVVGEFRSGVKFPSVGAALPAGMPGIGWSDHWAFWQEGYPAVMVTDSAPFRYDHYHTPQDTPDKLNYDAMARVAVGLTNVVRALAR